MSNYVVLSDNKIAFHPGYYIEEYIDSTLLTQEDFAKRLGTTPKNLSILIRGEQSLSTDIALKLSRLLGTSVTYWLNLQTQFDSMIALEKEKEELKEEIEILNTINYNYFKENFNLPNLPRKKSEQVVEVRNFLHIASLCLLKNKDLFVRFRGKAYDKDINIIKANTMVQIATNLSLEKKDFPKFDKEKLKEASRYVLGLTLNHDDFITLIRDKFYEAGVDLITLPNLSGSKINGATKKIDKHIMLMINDRNHSSDSFWFTLLHEVGHIINGDYGMSLEGDMGIEEARANEFAEESLISKEEYSEFIKRGKFTTDSLIKFSKKINRDPGIIVGRLEKDKYINYGDPRFMPLKHKYEIKNCY